jgi:hypothetical protein
VRFDVRAEAEAVLGCITSSAVEVALESVEIDNRSGRFELGEDHWDDW